MVYNPCTNPNDASIVAGAVLKLSQIRHIRPNEKRKERTIPMPKTTSIVIEPAVLIETERPLLVRGGAPRIGDARWYPFRALGD